MSCDYIAPAHDKDVWDSAGNIKKPRRLLLSAGSIAKPRRLLLKHKTDNIDCYKGAGYYRIAYSDGQLYTSDGPVWFDSYAQAEKAMADAWKTATPTHLPYSEYLGKVLFFAREE